MGDSRKDSTVPLAMQLTIRHLENGVVRVEESQVLRGEEAAVLDSLPGVDHLPHPLPSALMDAVEQAALSFGVECGPLPRALCRGIARYLCPSMTQIVVWKIALAMVYVSSGAPISALAA